MKILAALALTLLGSSCAQGADVFYTWDLEALLENDLSPDCMNIQNARRTLFLANDGTSEDGQLPGPLIEANEGDTIHVRITNKHPTEGVAIHWHGIHQIGTPYMDGPAGVTQCALGSKQSQEYVFEAYPAGTHYWHAHGSLHLADGLSGPIVVRAADPEPFEYDEERIIFLQDWYIQTSTQQLVGLMNWPFTWVGNPNSLLINGKGLAPACLEGGASFNDSTICLETCQEGLSQLAVIEVEEGMTYRLRLINAAQLVMMNVAIAGHNMTIVQVEGTNVEPVTVTSLDLSPGQRYDVLVTMDQDPMTYLMETTIRQRDIPDVQGLALLQYSGINDTFSEKPDTHPAWDDVDYGVEIDNSLFTLEPNAHPQVGALNATNVTRYVVVGTQNQIILDNGEIDRLVWGVNNMTNIKGKEPLIGTAYTAAQKNGWPSDIPDTQELPLSPPTTWDYAQEVLAVGGPGAKIGSEGEVVISIEEGEVVEIVLQNARALNGVAEFHPWHIHGHSFWVVGSGNGTFDESLTDTYNLENPVLRDTVTLWPLQWVALRFVADNPGVWFFHCHITAHLVMGMGFNMVVSPDVLDEPSESVTACLSTSLNSETGGNNTESSSAGFMIGTSCATLIFVLSAFLWM